MISVPQKRTESMQEYIARYRNKYNKIKSVKSTILKKEIIFNSIGFKHLIFKGAHRRTNKAIKNRLRLLSLASSVLSNSTYILDTRIRKESHYGGVKNVQYDAVEAVAGKNAILVRVIVRTIGNNGQTHFYSIMRH